MFLKLNGNGGKNKYGAFGVECNKAGEIYFRSQITTDIAPLQKLSMIKIIRCEIEENQTNEEKKPSK